MLLWRLTTEALDSTVSYLAIPQAPDGAQGAPATLCPDANCGTGPDWAACLAAGGRHVRCEPLVLVALSARGEQRSNVILRQHFSRAFVQLFGTPHLFEACQQIVRP